MFRPVFNPLRCTRLCIAALGLVALVVFLARVPDSMAEKTAEVPRDAQKVFERFNERVVKIEVLESGSGSKTSIGSGFYISDEGHVITNYHVISMLIYYPERYRAELVDHAGEKRDITVLGIDVLNDLAIVQADTRPAAFFRLGPVNMKQGVRLYSLGYPLDIGISIVEGTYNGFMEKAFYRKIHFTGSLNPGMSGGPAVNASGKVVGVNVATAGNQVSFLVPVKAVVQLMEKTLGNEKEGPEDFLKEIDSQLLSHQEEYFNEDVFRLDDHVELGDYVLPSSPAPFVDCWGEGNQDDDMPYETVSHTCSGYDSVFISSSRRALSVSFQHRVLTAKDLNRFRFFDLYSSLFGMGSPGYYGNEDEITSFRCSTRFVERNDITFKAVFCLRKHHKLEGLYDAIFKAASLESMETGLETMLTMNGVSFETAVGLADRYLGEISWKE